MDSFSETQQASAPLSPRNSSKRRRMGILIAFGVAIAVFVYIFIGVRSGTDKNQPSGALEGNATPSTNSTSVTGRRNGGQATGDDPTWGPKNAAVTIVEFSDFECPYCGQAFPAVQRTIQRYGDRVLFQYRDFPISDIHPHAQKAAEAAQCAHGQGKFWPYHDLLFQNQEALTREDLNRYALTLNLNIAAFNRCLDGNTETQEVLNDLSDGIAAGVNGTPTFFINGIKYEGVLSEEEFIGIIEGLL